MFKNVEKMSHKERILAAIRKEEVDKIPFGMWYHYPHVDQDPVALAELQIQLAQDYDLDFIKMMPFGNFQAADYGLSCTYFCTPVDCVKVRKYGIDRIEDWGEIRALPGCFGNHGKALMAAQQTAKQLKQKGLDYPFVQTLFSPLTIAYKLAGRRVFEDLRKEPALLHHALEEITKTSISYVEENIAAGVSGFFLADQCGTYDFLTKEEYREFGEKYDLMILEAARPETWFNIIHIHGENTMYELMASYPVDCVNSHDRWVSPDLREARKLTDKCLMGGINEYWLHKASLPEIEKHIREAYELAGSRGFIISPGCDPARTTPREYFMECGRVARSLQ